MKNLQELNDEYDRERFEMKMHHIYQRKYCEYVGQRQTDLHNLQRAKEKLKLQKRLLQTKKNPSITGNVRGLKKKSGNRSQVGKVKKTVYKPKTSQSEIESILRRKNIKLKVRGLPTTQISIHKTIREDSECSSQLPKDVSKFVFFNKIIFF